MSPIVRRSMVLVGAASAILVVATAAWAHDFWLVPDAFQIAAGGTLEIRGQTSSRFPISESAVNPARVRDARVLSATREDRVTDVSTSGTSLLLRHRPAGDGQRIVAVSLGWTSVRASGRDFKRYIELEGNPTLAARYERQGVLPKSDSITRRYAKYAKTLVQVGRGGPQAFARLAGHPLEFVPLKDPASLRVGDTLAFRLLFNGSPLAEGHVHGGTAVTGSDVAEVSLAADAQGIVRVPVTRPGLWNVRTIHVVPAPAGSGADWESHFATFVFAVAGTSSPDSAAVVEVVARYHGALAAGDSAGAVRLLAPDVMVLESGGLETFAEYRSHHLPGDIAFAAGVPSRRTVARVTVRGDVAWVVSTSTTQGQFRGRAVNSSGAELMVLTRGADGWRISAIHWSSRNRRSQ